MLKKLALLLVVLMAVSLDEGQSPIVNGSSPAYFAIAYGSWSLALVTANVYIFSPATACNEPMGSLVVFPFNTNAPLFINDDSNPETVTPSAVIHSGTQCGVTIAPAHSHAAGTTLMSATGGLQEALNVLASVSYVGPLYLDAAWYNAISFSSGTPSSVIAAAKGSTSISLVDLTKSPVLFYQWNGSSYAAYGFSGTKTAGSCTITYVNGIVTTITGC